MKTILFPTDFSPASTNALHYAAALAQDIHAALMIVHVFQIPVSMTDVPGAAITIDEIEAQTENQLEQLQHSVVNIFPHIQKVFTLATMGNITDELKDLSEHIQPFALVMGSHGNSGLEKFLMGSTTLSSIRNIKFPIFVIPPGVHYKKIEKIGLACDMEEVANALPLEKINSILEALHGKLYVLNVSDQPSAENSTVVLEKMLSDIPHEYHFIQKEDISEAIHDFAEMNNIDLLIMIPKKYQWLELLIHKSTSANLLKYSHIPLLSIKTNPAS